MSTHTVFIRLKRMLCLYWQLVSDFEAQSPVGVKPNSNLKIYRAMFPS